MNLKTAVGGFWPLFLKVAADSRGTYKSFEAERLVVIVSEWSRAL